MRVLVLACAGVLLACGGGTPENVPPPGDAGVPLAVLSVTPADGASAVRRDAAVVVRFNRAAANVTTDTVQLSDDGFVTRADGAFAASGDGATWTFTPAALLHAVATYRLRVTTGVRDAGGAALPAEFTSAGFTTEIAATLRVTGADLQHLSIAWTAPAGVSESRVYLAPAGEVYTVYTSYTSAPGAATLGPLPPGKSWNLKLTTVRDGVETPQDELRGVATGPTGAASEWLDDQQVAGERGGQFWFTWSDAQLFAASAALGGTEALWLAFDTDPDADATGEAQTGTGPGLILWPFKADAVIELNRAGARLRTGGTWAPLAASTAHGALSEIGFPRAALGNPARVRLAFAVLDSGTGAVSDLAPAHAGNEIPTTGRLASLTASLATQFGDFRSSAESPREPAAWLVTFAVAGPLKGPVQIAGNLPPFSKDLSLSEYQLHVAEIRSWDGRFNLGGAAGELDFKFADAGATEPLFAQGKDRVYTLSGGRETVPALTWNTPWGAGASFHLVFDCACTGATALREVLADGTFATLASPFSGTAEVAFEARDFVTHPLRFEAWSGAPGLDTVHAMDDDVLNTRRLEWTAGDGTDF